MLKRLLRSRTVRALRWVLLLLLVATAFNVLGIHLLGDTLSWSRWLDSHRAYFLAWRLFLYGAIAYAWRRMRSRMAQGEQSPEALMRLRRAEIGAVLVILALEGATALSSA